MAPTSHILSRRTLLNFILILLLTLLCFTTTGWLQTAAMVLIAITCIFGIAAALALVNHTTTYYHVIQENGEIKLVDIEDPSIKIAASKDFKPGEVIAGNQIKVCIEAQADKIKCRMTAYKMSFG